MKFLSYVTNKLKKTKAFSLSEVLVAVLIMSLSTATVAACIPVAMNVQNSVTQTANAQILLSTTLDSLRNELGLAEDVTISGSAIEYKTSFIQNGTKAFRKSTITSDSTSGVSIQYPGNNFQKLVSLESMDGLIVTYDRVDFDKSDKKCITFNSIKVMDTSLNKVLEEYSSYSIRTGE